jgi:hypothetical protein
MPEVHEQVRKVCGKEAKFWTGEEVRKTVSVEGIAAQRWPSEIKKGISAG